MTSSPPSITPEEHEQILQTIEMFEVIVQANPQDTQSLEILKDAYQKVRQPEESLRISRKLAEAYFNVGSYTLAMQECEVVLLKNPNAPEILAMLGEIEEEYRLPLVAMSARHRDTLKATLHECGVLKA